MSNITSSAIKRLKRDFRILQVETKKKGCMVMATPEGDNLFQWKGVIFGPVDTPWEGGTFDLTLTFSHEYPNKPPKVKFISKLFHPNIYTSGDICLDILQNNWSPIYDISAVLTSIQSLLSDPNPNSPANTEAAKLFSENRREYNRRVKLSVQESNAGYSDDDSVSDDDDGSDSQSEVEGQSSSAKTSKT